MKKYRYRKIRPEDVEVMKELREQGLSYKEIGKKFGVSYSTANYHLNPREKEMSRKRTYKSLSKLTKEQLKEIQLKQQKYRSEYMKDRYNSDERFRKDFCEMVKRNFEKRREVWKRENKCFKCGGDKIEKKWKMCENCRKKKRERKKREKGNEGKVYKGEISK